MNSTSRRAFAFGVLATMSGCVSLRANDRASVSAPPTWRLVGNSPRNAHQTSGSVRERPGTVWDHETADLFVGSPVVGDPGVIVATENAVNNFDVSSGDTNWRSRVDDRPSGSPALTSNGRVYVAADSYGVEDSERPGRLYALDEESGDVDWRHEVDSQRVFTPVAVDQTVYLSTREAVVAVDRDGTRQWRYDVDSPFDRISRRYANEISPVVADGTVFAPLPGGVAAIDADSGEQLWEYSLTKCRVAPSTDGDGTLFATGVADGVVALDVTDGEVIWNWDSENVWGGTALSDDRLFVTTGTDLVAVDTTDGTERWRFGIDGDSHCSPVLVGDTVVVGTVAGSLYGVSAETGKQRWKVDDGDGYYLPVAARDHLFLAAQRSLTCF